MSKNSARLGTAAATTACPPRRSSRSKRTTRWPSSAAETAACRPPGPPPTTTTFLVVGVVVVVRVEAGGGAASRPVNGFSMQPSHRLSPMRPTHSWLHERHVRMSRACPDPGLGREVGVGDLAADDPDEVTVTVAERPIGLHRVLEPTDPDDGQPDGGPDGARDVEGVARGDLHARLDHEESGRGHADRGVDVVDLAAVFDHASHLDGVRQRGAAVDELVAAQPNPEGTLGADGPRGRRR